MNILFISELKTEWVEEKKIFKVYFSWLNWLRRKLIKIKNNIKKIPKWNMKSEVILWMEWNIIYDNL